MCGISDFLLHANYFCWCQDEKWRIRLLHELLSAIENDLTNYLNNGYKDVIKISEYFHLIWVFCFGKTNCKKC